MLFRKIIRTVFVVAFSFCSVNAMNLQVDSDSANVVLSLSNTNQTIADFGYVLVGESDTIPLHFINKTSRTGLIVDRVAPFYFLTKTQNSNGRTFEEYDLIMRQRSFRFSNDTLLPLVYTANTNLGDYGLGVREARLDLSIRVDGDTSTLYCSNKSFILTAFKTQFPLYSISPELNFDSVYINPVLPKSIDWKIVNSSKSNTEGRDSIIQLSGKDNFKIDETPPEKYLGKRQYSRLVRFTPRSRGADSAIVTISHKNTRIDGVFDTVATRARGFGVQQVLNIYTVQPSGITFNKDTIDFGSIKQGDSVEVTIAIENSGNLPFFANAEHIEDVTANSKNFFFKSKQLHTSQAHIAPFELGTFKVKFLPTQSGDFLAKYVFDSDIEQRGVWGAPDTAKFKSLYLKGKGVAPKLSVVERSLSFDSVAVFAQCVDKQNRKVQVKNEGEDVMKGVRYSLKKGDAGFSLNKVSDDILPLSQDSVIVTFSPNTPGVFSDTLLIEGGKIGFAQVTLSGKGVSPKNLTLTIPSQLRVKPGNLLRVPLEIDGSVASLTSRFSTRVRFDSTVLQYKNFSVVSTIFESAAVSVSQISPDEIELSAAQESLFANRNTAINLEFDSYLGRAIETSITLENPKIGNSLCEELFPITKTNGSVVLDSVCGLEQKVGVFTNKFFLSDPSPVPAGEFCSFTFNTPFPVETKAILSTCSGETVEILLDNILNKGTHTVSVNTSILSNGCYTISLSAGLFKQSKLIMVAR